jgi:hypothetical protein
MIAILLIATLVTCTTQSPSVGAAVALAAGLTAVYVKALWIRVRHGRGAS